MFCKYCGKQLQENEVCSCRTGAETQQAQAEKPAQSQQVEQMKQVAAQAQQKVAQNLQAAATAVKQSGTLKELLRNPVGGLKEAYQTGDTGIQYGIGGIYLLCTLLFVLTTLMKTGVGFGWAFLVGIFLVLTVAVVKLIHAVWFHLFSDKSRGFSRAMAAVCAGSLHEAICLAILSILTIFGWSTLATLMLFMLFIVTPVANCTAACAICREKKGYMMYMLLTAILLLLVMLIGRSIISGIVDSVVGGLTRFIF